MRIAVLAANGRTGKELTRQALARGHHVIAIARRAPSPGAQLTPIAADVTDPVALREALKGADAVVSGLGLVKGSPPDLLSSAAKALVEAALPHGSGGVGGELPQAGPLDGDSSQEGRPRGPRIVWLGAFGTGRSAARTGPATRLLLKMALGDEIPDKVAADEVLLNAGATVVHAGPLTNGPLHAGKSAIDLNDVKRRRLPKPVSRATVAVAMLDAAEQQAEGAGRVLLV